MIGLNGEVPRRSQHGDQSNHIHALRSEETSAILQPLLHDLLQFQAKADEEIDSHRKYTIAPHGTASVDGSSLVAADSLSSKTLLPRLDTCLRIPEHGSGRDGLLSTAKDILTYSVNPSAPGFLDKLYAAPLPPGIAAELILAFLNTNLHVYQVSPVLTLIEKRVSKALAEQFGFHGPRAGGISVQGGSASNLTSIVVARNTLFPHTKIDGNSAENGGQLLMFTSAHGHYSIEKAAQALGLGSKNVVTVPVDEEGRMIPSELNHLIIEAKAAGKTPFYINATAGTTVLGSFDRFDQLAKIAKNHRCWLHVDGSWGGSFVFTSREDIRSNLKGLEKADSIAINPHKMLGVPVTCSFLLTRDLRLFETAMTLRAGYLFHDVEDDDDDDDDGIQAEYDDETMESKDVADPVLEKQPQQLDLYYDDRGNDVAWREPDDLADLTLQCGRRGDSLKFFLSWQYYGTTGYQTKVDAAYELALYMSRLVDESTDLTSVFGAGTKPQCLQICFNFTPSGKFPFGTASSKGVLQIPMSAKQNGGNDVDTTEGVLKTYGKYNTIVTARITKALIAKGFMIDFAPALEGQQDKGSFFRVVLNISTIQSTVERLMHALVEVGGTVLQQLSKKYRPVT